MDVSLEPLVRALVESVPDIAFVYDARKCILFASRAAERILGYSPGELPGYSIEQTNSLGRANKESRAEYLQAVFTQKRAWSGIWHKVNRDGLEISGQLTATPVVQDDVVQAVVEAIRLRKAQPDLERELALEALLNEKTMELMTEMAIIVGSLGELAFVNHAFTQLIGEPSSRLVGRAAGPYFEEGFLATLRTDAASGPAIHRRPTTMRLSSRARPREVVVSATVLAIEDQAEPYLLVVIEDLMELAMARTHSRRMAQALDLSREIVIWTDPEGRLLDATPQARRTLGLEVSGARSRRLEDLVCDIPTVEELIAQARHQRVLRMTGTLASGRALKVRGRLVPTRDGRSQELVLVLRVQPATPGHAAAPEVTPVPAKAGSSTDGA